MKRISVLTVYLIMILGNWQLLAVDLPILRISTENTDTHVQTIAARSFAKELKSKLSGILDVRFYANAQLFRDNDVIKALSQGKLEMAIPGTWHISKFEPSIGVFLLPMFYGRTAAENHKIIDGQIGQVLNKRIEHNLHLKVLGRWIDLGHAHLFGVNKKISSHLDIRGLRVRVAGGIGNELRIKAFNGLPMTIAWPDLPEYLQKGNIDAILTSYETIRSDKLWRYGVRYAFEDREYFPQYIPLIRLSFWKKLPVSIQKIIEKSWDEQVDTARENAAEAQLRAKKILIKEGIQVVIPSKNQIVVWRKKILPQQVEFVKTMGIDPELVELIDSKFNE